MHRSNLLKLFLFVQEKVRLLSETKSSFELIASTKLRASRKSNSLESVPQVRVTYAKKLQS